MSRKGYIFFGLVFVFVGLIFFVIGVEAYNTDPVVAGWLIILGFCGCLLGGYFILRPRPPFAHALQPKQIPLKTCSQCGKLMPSSAKFCIGCGAKIAQEKTPVEQKEKSETEKPPEPKPQAKTPFYCRYCGVENNTDAVFCEKCGKRIS